MKERIIAGIISGIIVALIIYFLIQPTKEKLLQAHVPYIAGVDTASS